MTMPKRRHLAAVGLLLYLPHLNIIQSFPVLETRDTLCIRITCFGSLLWFGYYSAVQSCTVWACVSLAEAEFVLALCFQLSILYIEQHFSTPQSTWTEPSWVQLTAVCYRRSSSSWQTCYYVFLCAQGSTTRLNMSKYAVTPPEVLL